MAGNQYRQLALENTGSTRLSFGRDVLVRVGQQLLRPACTFFRAPAQPVTPNAGTHPEPSEWQAQLKRTGSAYVQQAQLTAPIATHGERWKMQKKNKSTFSGWIRLNCTCGSAKGSVCHDQLAWHFSVATRDGQLS